MTAPEFATLTTDDLVTGEAVALDLPPASLGLRIASGMIDYLATMVAPHRGLFLFARSRCCRPTRRCCGRRSSATVIVSSWSSPPRIETLTRGRSLGKLALGLRTVRDDAGPITFQHSFIRALVGFVEIYAFAGRRRSSRP